MIDLSGKVVLVTGGSRGIGAAIVRTVAAAGGRVLLHYGKNVSNAQSISAEIGNDRCHVVQASLDKRGEARSLWSKSLGWEGRIDVLVNNAGVYEAAGVDDEIDSWHETGMQTLQIN